eukprot:COSAG01_NODE_40_length_32708_cov_25.641234_24_plen_167_part_00
MVFEKCDIRMTFTYTADRGGAVGPPWGAPANSSGLRGGLGRAAYLFLNSSLLKQLPGDYNYKDGGSGRTFLGRPWGPLAFVVFKDTYMDSHIEPAGWDDGMTGPIRAASMPPQSASWILSTPAACATSRSRVPLAGVKTLPTLSLARTVRVPPRVDSRSESAGVSS